MTARRTIIAASLALVSCGGGQWSDESRSAVQDSETFSAPMIEAQSAQAAPPAGAPPAPGVDSPASPSDGVADAEPSGSYLAYTYNQRLEVPGARLAAVMDAHVAACRAAGEARCQLMVSVRDSAPDGRMFGTLTVRGEPQWLQGFMQSVVDDANGAGGRLVSSGASTEDLTRQIVDSEASLRASRALRERLLRLLETRPGTLQDLLAVERELTRVQTEIDATESTLAVMRRRVSMSTLTVTYDSLAPSVSTQTFGPLRNALRQFIGRAVDSTATLVSIVAGLLPWALVVAVLVWAVRRWARG